MLKHKVYLWRTSNLSERESVLFTFQLHLQICCDTLGRIEKLLFETPL